MADNSPDSGCLTSIGAVLIVLALMSFSNGVDGGEFFFLTVGIILIVVANNKGPAKPSLEKPEQASSSHRLTHPDAPTQDKSGLQIKVSTKKDKIRDTQFNFIKFHTKGIFSHHYRITRPCFEFRLCDITDTSFSDAPPVLCVIDELQDENSTEFRFRQILPEALDAGAGSFDWIEFCSIPMELLVFPVTGSRRIKAILRVTDTTSGRMIATANTVWSTFVEGVGYLEMEFEESEAQAASLQLAMCIAAADGCVDDDEIKVIKGWGERTLNALPTARQATRRSVLNEALQTATREIRAKRTISLESNAINALREKGDARFLYDAYELCLNVLKADGEAHPKEMAQLTRLARQLGLDKDKVSILTDRHLIGVNFTPVEDESEDDHILGITSEMSKDQIRRHLNKLYQKHQARTQHDNPDVIVKAKEWLDRISRARVRHLGS